MAWFALGIASGILLTRAADATLAFAADIAREFASLHNLEALYADHLETGEAELPPAGEKAELVSALKNITAAAFNAAPAAMHHYPRQVALTARRGDTLLDMLIREGLAREEAYSLVQALKPAYNLRRLRPSHAFTLTLDKAPGGGPMARNLTIVLSKVEKVVVTRAAGGSFRAAKEAAPLARETVRAGGRITSSFYQTAKDAGVPERLVAELINAYSYDVDFQRDLKSGDALEVLFEQIQTKSGDAVGSGNVLHATLTLGGKEIPIYRYTDGRGVAGYYNARGESVRKALLKTPVNGARISSGYGQRRHPILGYTKMHKGVDFAAPAGTPIYAAGDGTVEYAGRHGGYGNYVRVRHNGQYATAYAHMHRFGKGIRLGRHVRQGEVIGYVGSTGRSTGPHLHYEILARGRQINPSGVKFKTGRTLEGRELARFKARAHQLDSLIASLPRLRTEVAAMESSGSPLQR